MRPMRSSAGNLIRRGRLSAGLSQQELARRAGVSERSVREIEAGRVNRPRASSLHRLAKALDFSHDDLDLLMSTETAIDDQLHIGVLGPLFVREGDAPRHIKSIKQQELLGLLALRPWQPVSREEIIDVLWGDRPPKTCLNLVQGYVGSLRRLLHGDREHHSSISIVTSTRGGYTLQAEAGHLDLMQFDDLQKRAQGAQAAGRLTSAKELFGQALRCWRGSALAGSRLCHHPVSVALDQRRMDVALAYADIALTTGDYRDVATRLNQLAMDEPMHEGLHGRLMLALAGGGDQAAALRLFTVIRSRLADELGVEPGHELAAAHLQVLRQQLPVLVNGSEQADRSSAASAPATDTGAAAKTPPAQLPLAARGFAGRLSELAELDASLASRDRPDGALTVLIVSGTAGVGKTTLAVHWAHKVRDRFPDGQLYLNLRGFAPTGPAMEPAAAIRSFLDALGVPPERVPPAVEAQAGLYRSLLADRRMLVLLDNARDVEQVRPLLPGAAGCLIVVTSRNQLLGLVATENAHPLTVDLFSASEGRELLAHRLGVERTAAEPEAADEIVSQCARLPLALAIVTARALAYPRFSLATLAEELRQARESLDAFDGGEPATQVRTVFSWSYRTLSKEAARLFRMMAIHPGPDIGIHAAACLAGLTPAGLRQPLAELVRTHLISEYPAGRYTFHDLLRIYAAERNREEDGDNERATATQRLYQHYLHTAHAATRLLYPQKTGLPQSAPPPELPILKFEAHSEALDWLDTEHPNLVAAITLAAQRGPHSAAWLLADALRAYLQRRQHSVHWLAVTEAGMSAARAEGDLHGQAAMHISTAAAHHAVARHQQAIVHLRHVAELSRQAGWLEGEAVAFCNLGAVYGELGQLEEAMANLLRGHALYGQAQLWELQAVVLNNLGNTERLRGGLKQAADYLRQALGLWRPLGSSSPLSTTLNSLGQVYYDLGRFTLGAEHLNEAVTFGRQTRDHAIEASSLACLSRLHCDAGRTSQALQAAHAAVRLSDEIASPQRQSSARIAIAASYRSVGRHQEAIEDYRQGLHLARKAASRHLETDALIGLSTVHRRLGDHDRASGHARDALAIAREAHFRVLEGQALTALAEIHLRRRQPVEAASYARDAIDLHRGTGHRFGEARALVCLGTVLRQTEDSHAALHHWQEALALFTDIGTPDSDRVRALIERHGPVER